MVGRTSFAFERFGSPRHSSDVAQLSTLGYLDDMRLRSYILLILPALFIVIGMLTHNKFPMLTLRILVPASFICAILGLLRGIKIFKSQIGSGLVFILVSVFYLAVLILSLGHMMSTLILLLFAVGLAMMVRSFTTKDSAEAERLKKTGGDFIKAAVALIIVCVLLIAFFLWAITHLH